MRRSAAPSQNSSKKSKFCTPYTHTVKRKKEKFLNKCDDERTISNGTPQSDSDFQLICPVECLVKSQDEQDLKEPQIKISSKKNFQMPLIKQRTFPIQPQQSPKPDSLQEENEKYFSVVWCKISNKKHKSWEDDGILLIKGKLLMLLDSEGKQIAKGSGYKTEELKSIVDGGTLRIGSKELEVQKSISKECFVSGKCFKGQSAGLIKESTSCCKLKAPVIPFQSHARNPAIAKKVKLLQPRHDPLAEGVLVMKRPLVNKTAIEVLDVVVDPYLSNLLRPHQREGVQFLYDCVMGIKNANSCGAILADEMGLGKTLQCITIAWTLLKQGPYGKPAVKNVLIVTPGSLVKNWHKEFLKWLGSERILPFAANSKNRVDEFLLRPKENVLIISYEMLVRCIEDIRKIKFSLVICDEAHRLKNSNIKASTLITSLDVPKRILLTGTPIQNNLEEFHTLAELANPGILGTPASFKRVFITPITRGQQPDCSEEEKLIAISRGEELTRLTSQFCLRRTSEVNKCYLPAKVEHVVFVQSSPLQRQIYTKLLAAKFFRSCLSNGYNGSQHLVCISALKKLCNDPRLFYSSVKGKDQILYESVIGCFPDNFDPDCVSSSDSCKLVVLRNLFQEIKVDGGKVVVVANSTKALDKLQELCDSLMINNTRLDGKTSTDVRQKMVDRFNSPQSDLLVFLLSSKAGGVGLNLIGASRLVLYDIDWNPANDVQAMARIWRDGQKREVHIYRLLVTGTIEEKIYQRQLQKQCLSSSVVDSLTNDKIQFSTADLKDLFSFQESKTCCTHELLQCACDQENAPVRRSELVGQKQKNLSMAELMNWEHIKDVKSEVSLAPWIKECNNISFLFRNKTS